MNYLIQCVNLQFICQNFWTKELHIYNSFVQRTTEQQNNNWFVHAQFCLLVFIIYFVVKLACLLPSIIFPKNYNFLEKYI